MNVEKGFLNKLVTKRLPPTGPGFLKPIDTRNLAKYLDVVETASKNGSGELPKSSAIDLDAKESEIVQHLQSEYSWQVGELYSQLRAYSIRLTKYSIQTEFQQLKIQANDTLALLGSVSKKAEAELGPKLAMFKDRKQEFQHFRKDNKIGHAPRESSSLTFTVGLLFFLTAFESVINGFFFSKGAEFGLVGGVGIAVGISIVNVVSAFLVGYGPGRWIFHRSFIVKILAVTLLAAFLIGTICLQFLAAHYRDASSQFDSDQAFQQAVHNAFEYPFVLQEINSYYLVGLGLLFSLLSYLKGCFQDDPYPGYGANWRRLQAAENDYISEHFHFFDELDEVKDICISKLNDGIKSLPRYPQTSADIEVQRKALLAKFKVYETALIQATNDILKIYRETNKEHRTSKPPKYFDHAWTLTDLASNSEDTRVLLASMPQEQIDLRTILLELNDLIAKVHEKYSALIEKYPHSTEITYE